MSDFLHVLLLSQVIGLIVVLGALATFLGLRALGSKLRSES